MSVHFQPQMSPMFGSTRVMGYGGFNYIYNQRWSVGLGIGGLMSNTDVAPPDTLAGYPNLRWAISYFGLTLGRDFWPDRLIYVSVNVHIGGGSVSKHVVDRGAFTAGNNLDDSRLFSLHPTVAVGVNLTPWLRAFFSGGYRYLDYSATQGATRDAMSGWTAGFGLALGLFQPPMGNGGQSNDAD